MNNIYETSNRPRVKNQTINIDIETDITSLDLDTREFLLKQKKILLLSHLIPLLREE